MKRPAVGAVARYEWGRRWRGLLLLGLAAGAFAGVIVAGAVLTRRTDSAPDRLYAAVSPGELHVKVFGGRELAEHVASMPGIGGRFVGGVTVGRVEGTPGVRYTGILANIDATPGMLTPVVLRGRMPRSEAVEEIAIREDAAAGLGVGVGDTITVSMLTAQEVTEFDTGFGEPDGPRLELSITAIVRMPPTVLDGSPILATRAFAQRWSELFAGFDVYVAVPGGAADVMAVRAELDALASELAAAAGDGADFSPLAIDDPRAATDALQSSSRVLIGGLVAALVAATIAVLAASGQAWSRHHAGSASNQRIEAALGMTTVERVAARAIPALPSAAVAAVVAGAVGTLGGLLRPAGALDRAEPSPGFRFDAAVAVLGAAIAAAMVFVGAVVSAWRAGRDTSAPPPRGRGGWWRAIPRRNGWPLAGVTLAVSSGGSQRSVPIRTSLLGGVIGLSGLTAALTFGASLHRLEVTPQRWGFLADVIIADVQDADIEELSRDQRFATVADVVNADVRVDGEQIRGQAYTHIRGDLSWVLLRGRLPAAAGEVVLGSRLARDLDREVGDVVVIGDGASATVVGVGIGPQLGNEDFAASVLFHPDGIRAAGSLAFFREATLGLAPGVDLESTIAALAARYELVVREIPPEVRDVTELGSLPEVLGVFLAAIAALALAHALVVTCRRRRRDLAVMRAVGATPRQAGLTIATIAMTTFVVGVVAGVPLGWALARLVWGQVAESLGVRGDVVFPTSAALAIVAAAAVTGVIAVVPARRAMRTDPGLALRSE